MAHNDQGGGLNNGQGFTTLQQQSGQCRKFEIKNPNSTQLTQELPQLRCRLTCGTRQCQTSNTATMAGVSQPLPRGGAGFFTKGSCITVSHFVLATQMQQI